MLHFVGETVLYEADAVVDTLTLNRPDRLYTGKARAAAGGAHCPMTLAQSAGGLRDPRVKIVSVVVRGRAATVTVAASVNGKPPVTDAIRLEREGGRYRIASAGAG